MKKNTMDIVSTLAIKRDEHHDRGLKFMNAKTQQERDQIWAEEKAEEKKMMDLISQLLGDGEI